jgi:serine/threonine protein kinase
MAKRGFGTDALAGTRAGPYEIVRRVGHGASASVFEAVHTTQRTRVAMKRLHDHLAGDEQAVGRFLREGRLASRLRHPNIAQILDVGTEDGSPYIVMEFLDGEDLRVLLAREHVLSVPRALEILLPIAAALAHAHDAGVTHRDVKPANILLTRNRSKRDESDPAALVPMLVDFGLSKAASVEGDVTAGLTSTELVAGTVRYMAPEQTFGVKNASPASDQYSLAAILYEATTGQPPFVGEGIYVLIDQIRGDLIKPPSLVREGIDPAFDDVLLRALARKPEKRWRGVRDFGRELLRFAGEPTARAMKDALQERASGAVQVATEPVRVASETNREAPRDPAFPPSEPSRVASRPGLRAVLKTAPPLPVPPGRSPFQIKGNTYRGVVARAQALPRGLDGLCEKIADPEVRYFLRQPFLASGLYDLLPILPITVAFAEVLGIPLDELVRSGTTAQASYDARTIFRTVIEVRPIDEIPERLARIGARFYDSGAYSKENRALPLSGSRTGKNEVTLLHVGMPSYVLPWYEPMIAAYTTAIAEFVSGRSVEGTTFEVTARAKNGPFPVVTSTLRVRFRPT